MEHFTKAKNFILILIVLSYVSTSSQQHIDKDNRMLNDDHQLSLQIVVHGFLLWASLGFLIPVGILTIRLSNGEERGRRARIMFYIHAVTQILSVILVIAATILSIRNFSNNFNNMHRRLGVVLYGLVFLQAVSGIFRPSRENKRRSVWFFGHWVLGTAVSLLGIINVYTGLHAYQNRTSTSITPWVIVFTAEIVCIGSFYLFQEKWEYILNQGVTPVDEPATSIQSTDNREAFTKQNRNPC